MVSIRVQHVVCFSSLLAAILAVGCESNPRNTGRPVFFPAPPAEPRVQFLTWANGAEDVEPSKGKFQEFILGEEPRIQRMIDKPYGLAARDGVVYVCDTKGLSLCKLDFANKKYSVIGVRGPGRLRKPINLVMDELGFKFVVDPVREEVVVFGPDDNYVRAFEVPKPCRPVDIAQFGDELYVLDNDETPQIVVMDRSSGAVKRTFGSAGGDPGQFNIPNSLAIDPEGFLYVSDTHNWRIQKLTGEGQSVWVRGTAGYMLGQFGRPRGVRVGPDGILYVVDGATELVQMFNAEGRTLMRFGGPGETPGSMVLPSTLAIDATSIPYFKQYIHKDFTVDYLLFVANQYGSRLINVYAFGSFPEGYELSESEVATIPRLPMEQGVGMDGEEEPAGGAPSPE